LVSDLGSSSALGAFEELEQLVRHLGDELAGFRRRALQAEARVKELEAAVAGNPIASSADVERLEAENARLAARLETAGGQARQLLERVRFLRQQNSRGGDR
jgi:hypothetical protein